MDMYRPLAQTQAPFGACTPTAARPPYVAFARRWHPRRRPHTPPAPAATPPEPATELRVCVASPVCTWQHTLGVAWCVLVVVIDIINC